jgi:excisionase family DNA binding protein
MDEVLSAHQLAERLQLPLDWIKSQAKAGRLPHLKIGRRRLFNPDAVRKALARMAASEEASHATC